MAMHSLSQKKVLGMNKVGVSAHGELHKTNTCNPVCIYVRLISGTMHQSAYGDSKWEQSKLGCVAQPDVPP